MGMKILKYKCITCGKVHEGSPSFSVEAPAQYENKTNLLSKIFLRKYINADFCRNNNDFFIRVILEVPIIGVDEPFTWGVWVSQSQKNYIYYQKHFHDNLLGRETFGWFCNALPYYKNTLGLKTIVFFQNNKNRPKIHLQECGHELSIDFHQGISIEKAKEIANIVHHKNENHT